MQNLFDINKLWFSRILSDLSDSKLKAAYDVLQQFFVICDLADVYLYYELGSPPVSNTGVVTPDKGVLYYEHWKY